jgi:hypothetical protein
MGCCLPDNFLSYSRDDQTTARLFAEGFEREGFSIWWDATLNPGEAFDPVTIAMRRTVSHCFSNWQATRCESRIWVGPPSPSRKPFARM